MEHLDARIKSGKFSACLKIVSVQSFPSLFISRLSTMLLKFGFFMKPRKALDRNSLFLYFWEAKIAPGICLGGIFLGDRCMTQVGSENIWKSCKTASLSDERDTKLQETTFILSYSDSSASTGSFELIH